MDFIEDDMEEVGSDIEAYCPKCKVDCTHTVTHKYEEEIRRVQCSTCGDVHTYRKPRGDVEEDIPEPLAAKKRANAKKPTWQEAIDKAGPKAVNAARAYSIRDRYHEGELVSHPKFGVGSVTEISENKAEVTFQDERRVLVHNRPDLAAQMPAIAPIPLPRDDKKSKRGKKEPKPEPKPVETKGKKPEPVKAAPPPAAKARPPEVKVPAAKPVKATAKAPEKAPAKPVKPVAKAPAKPVKPVAKAPAKPVKPVAKAPVAKPVKPVAKLPAKAAKPAKPARAHVAQKKQAASNRPPVAKIKPSAKRAR